MSDGSDFRRLLGHLDARARNSLEAAALKARAGRHHEVSALHWLAAMLADEPVEITELLALAEIPSGALETDVSDALAGLAGGWNGTPAFSSGVQSLLAAAWRFASGERDDESIRPADVLIGTARSDTALKDMGATVAAHLARLTKLDLKAKAGSARKKSSGGMGGDSGEMLQAYTEDLTLQARAGKIDPVIGRDPEIRQVVDILTRRRQNNPILIGEPGVGKTALVEGFARKIAEGDVPPMLRDVQLRSLDLTLLQAGAGARGEFERRLTGVIDAVKASEAPIILFIDEAHQMVGAGGSAGQGDAANIVKPALARGELRTIAATTWSEYKKYFEKDAALTRRFQVVRVDEPDEETAIAIMRGLVGPLERHHGVRIEDDAVVASVQLSARYVAGRQLPDKSVSLLDTTCARVAMSRAATPAPLDDLKAAIRGVDDAISLAERARLELGDAAPSQDDLLSEKTRLETEAEALKVRWEKETALLQQIAAQRLALTDAAAQDGDDTRFHPMRETILALNDELCGLQADGALAHAAVDAEAVGETVEQWTGVPVRRVADDQADTVRNLASHLGARVIGQDHALRAIAQAVQISRAGLAAPEKPIGVFLLAGTSGVGKTETALALADLLFGSTDSLTTINMTEYKEEHKVSLLMGSPPGYVGYGEGGVLTEAVRRRPYGIVLLDEMEKAHPSVHDVFFQVFDKGVMTDSEGREVDFRNTLLIMTSNAGTATLSDLHDRNALPDDDAALLEALRPEMSAFFKPAFLGRCTILPYRPLDDDALKQIIALKLRSVARRLVETYGMTLDIRHSFLDHVAARSSDPDTGARTIDLVINGEMLPKLSLALLEGMHEQGPPPGRVVIGFAEDIGVEIDFAT